MLVAIGSTPLVLSFLNLSVLVAVVVLPGIAFGWLYWRLGLESAILAHFLADALELGVVVPAYLSGSPRGWMPVVAGLVVTALVCLRIMIPPGGTEEFP